MIKDKELKPHYEVVCAVIAKNDKIFWCQRGSKRECAFKWEFPGGKIEPGETKEEALLREIKEELNCNINIEKFITTINHEYNTFLLTMHVYLCSLKDSEPILLEHKSSVWCDKDKLNELDFAEADYKFLDKIKKIIDAQKDIDEINNALNDIDYFHIKSNEIYERINSNKEYTIYIKIMKKKFNMNGNNHFKVLNYRFKREVFKIFVASINLYITKEIIDTK